MTVDPGGRERVLPVRLGLISLDFAGLAELYAAADARGIGWVEVFLDAVGSEQDVQTVERWRDAGIRVASISTLAKLNLASEAELPQHVRLVERSLTLARRVGAPAVTFMYGSQPALGPVEARDRFLRRLEPLVRLAETSGVRILVENVFSRGSAGDLDTVEAIVDVFERVDPDHVRLNFDPANLTIAGAEAYPAGYRALRPYIGSIHLKDVRRLRNDDYPLGDRRVLEAFERGAYLVVPLGEGDLDVAGLVDAFKRDPLDVVLSLEATAQHEDCERWLDASLGYLERLGIVSETRRPTLTREGVAAR